MQPETEIDTSKTYIFSDENNVNSDTIINLYGLVYDVSSGTSTEKVLPKTTSCTNWIFAYELTVNKHDTF